MRGGTSKVVVLSPSARPDYDVDYRFGAVAVDRPVIDWSGNCGNLSAAVGSTTIGSDIVNAPADGEVGGRWTITRVSMSRPTRRIMEGWVRVPMDTTLQE